MSKAVTHVMEDLYKNDKLLHNRLKVLENTAVVVVKATLRTYRHFNPK